MFREEEEERSNTEKHNTASEQLERGRLGAVRAGVLESHHHGECAQRVHVQGDRCRLECLCSRTMAFREGP